MPTSNHSKTAPITPTITVKPVVKPVTPTVDSVDFLYGDDEFLSTPPTNLNLTPEQAFARGLCSKSYVNYRNACDRAANQNNQK